MIINLPIVNKKLLDPGTIIKYAPYEEVPSKTFEGKIKEVIIELGEHIPHNFYRFVYILKDGKRVPEDQVVFPEYRKECIEPKKKLLV